MVVSQVPGPRIWRPVESITIQPPDLGQAGKATPAVPTAKRQRTGYRQPQPGQVEHRAQQSRGLAQGQAVHLLEYQPKCDHRIRVHGRATTLASSDWLAPLPFDITAE